MTLTRVSTPFGAESTATDVLAGIDLTGRRAVVTGGASGIGVETARALAGAGAEVTLAVRDLEAGERTRADIVGSTGNPDVHVAGLELADPSSIAAFVAAWSGPLHLLVNNAGVMGVPLTRNTQGWELHLATNHLGHFALAVGLRDALAEAAGSRVVSLTSVGHLNSDIVFDDLHFERRDYEPSSAYGQSKTANALFAVEANRRWGPHGISVNAVHPGAILETKLVRHYDPDVLAGLVASGTYTFKTPAQGAATSVMVATSPLLEGVGGRYFEDCQEAEPNQPGAHRGVAAYALDPESAARLWHVSEELTGLSG